MKKIIFSFVLIMLILSFAAYCQQPKIKFGSMLYDFGVVTQNDKVKVIYSFTNIGDSVLIIKNVRPSCGCTAPLPTKTEIQKGEWSTIEATFNTTRFRGNISKTIYVETNDPEHAQVVLTLTGVVDEGLSLSPNQLYFINARKGDKINKDFMLTSTAGKRFKITKLVPSNPSITILKSEAVSNNYNPAQNYYGYKIFVNVDTSVYTNAAFNEKIIIYTDDPKFSQVEQKFYGDILPYSGTNK